MIHVHSICIKYMVQIQYHWKILEFLLYEKNNTTQNDIYSYMFQLYCCVREITQILHQQAKVVAVGLNCSAHKFNEASLVTQNHAAQNGTQPRCPSYLFFVCLYEPTHH